MSRYTLEIVVQGHDRASGPLARVNNALSGIGKAALVAGGVALAAVGAGVVALGKAAFSAAADMQLLGIQLETLSARELNAAGIMSYADSMGAAAAQAAGLIQELRRISMLSPYQWDMVSQSLRLNMAYGATSKTAMRLVEAQLDFASAMGLTNEMYDRLSYNLAQALIAGDLTMANMRQLKLVGLDLAGVIEKAFNIAPGKDQLVAMKEGELTLEKLQQTFIDWVENSFPNASKKLTRTWQGLVANLKDVVTFAGADTLGPTLQNITNAILPFVDKMIGMVQSGVFKELGAQIGNFTSLLLEGDWSAALSALALPADVTQKIRDVAAALSGAAEKAGEFVAAMAAGAWQAGLGWFTENGETVATAIRDIGGALAELFGMIQVDGADAGTVLGLLVDTGLGELLVVLQGVRDLSVEMSDRLQGLVGSFENMGTLSPGWVFFLTELQNAFGRLAMPATSAKTDVENIGVAMQLLADKASILVSWFETEIPKAVTTATGAFRKFASDAAGAVSAGAGELYQAGVELVASIQRGVSSRWDAFKAWFKREIQALIRAILGELKIGSPSRVFVEIGQQMAAGMQVGWMRGLQPLPLATVGAMPGGGALQAAGSGFSGTVIFEGDDWTINDPTSMQLAMALTEERRRTRLDAFMGVSRG